MKKIIVVISIVIMLIAVDVFAANCPCRIVLNNTNTVVMVDKNNNLIKRYSNTMNRSNREVYSDGQKFWLMRSNNWVNVYNIETGSQIKNYYVPPGSHQSWVR